MQRIMAEGAIDYGRVKQDLRSNDVGVRLAIAGDRTMPGEFLYFLAEDEAVEVRRAVAENPSTPNQADLMLARDSDYSVRCALARKIVGEGLDSGDRRGLWRMGFTILETLACDQLVRVRRILTEAFKSPPDAPPEIVRTLARDRSRQVAAPVLRESPVLSDEDIIDIIANDAPDWAQQAVAGRDSVSPRVSDALAKAGSVPAVRAMIANPNAEIPEPTLDGIVERSAETPEWQEPLVNRPSLSEGLIVKLARFVSVPLLAALRRRGGMNAATVAELDRVAADRGAPADPEPSGAALFRGRKKRRKSADVEAAPADAEDGKGGARGHSDAAVTTALERGDTELVIEALAARADLQIDTVRRMVSSNSARTITALCWKAKFSMRFALDVQRSIGRISPQSLLYARDGVDFPLTPRQMAVQLALFAD